ncbi:MAG: hypothetical protein ABWJ97_07310 [Thermoproteus sp.]
MKVRLLDLDRGGEVEVEISPEASLLELIERLKAVGALSAREAAVVGVTADGRTVAYVPAANVAQLAAYSNQIRAALAFRRFPLHGSNR